MKNFQILCSFILISFFSVAFAASTTEQTNSDKIDPSTGTPLLPEGDNVYLERLEEERIAEVSPFSFLAYRPTYVLPYYYTGNPDTAVYGNTLSPGQSIQSSEAKAQFSVQIPIWENIYNSGVNFRFGYTQLMYLQAYQSSPFFRETDYEPALFLNGVINKWFSLSGGLVHQSNGKGGELERTWNRVYAEGVFSTGNWMVNIQPWVPIFPTTAFTENNSNIAQFLGYGRIVVAYKYHDHVFSMMVRNQLESGFQRGAVELTWSYTMTKHLKLYGTFFSGYGQSLIEYNHFTNSFGVGIAFTDWI